MKKTFFFCVLREYKESRFLFGGKTVSQWKKRMVIVANRISFDIDSKFQTRYKLWGMDTRHVALLHARVN